MSKSLRDMELKIEKADAEFRQRQKAKWNQLIPEIAYVLLKCGATRHRAIINEIASEAFETYPYDFSNWFGQRRIPDHALILLTLTEGKRRKWGYVAGDWFHGWWLTRKGLAFARDVDRRKRNRTYGSSAT